MPTAAFDEATGRCRVEFRLPAEAGAERAWLAGEFNGWSTDSCPLERRPDGSLAVEVDLEPGRHYRYRYYLGDGDWENDWAADDYVDNDHGGADSVLYLPAPPSPPPPVTGDAALSDRAAAKKSPAKKAAAKGSASKKAAATKDGSATTKKRPAS